MYRCSPRINVILFFIFIFASYGTIPSISAEEDTLLPPPEEILPAAITESKSAVPSFLDNLSWAALGSIFYLASDNGKVGADPPAVLPSLGFSAAWQFWGPLKLEITEDLYFTNYEYNAALGYPMACNPENRSAFVMGFVTGIQVTGYFPLGRSGMAARVYAGPAMDFRLVVLGIGLDHPSDFTGDIETDAQLQTNAIAEYFWGEGRWFLPVAGLGMDFPSPITFFWVSTSAAGFPSTGSGRTRTSPPSTAGASAQVCA
jgi:hypothetical protein